MLFEAFSFVRLIISRVFYLCHNWRLWYFVLFITILPVLRGHKVKSVIDTTETAILKEKIAFLEAQLVKAEEREERLRESEEWLKRQVETAQETIKLLEYKQPSQQQSKKGLFGRLLGAINND